jgi:UDP-N-acetylmuramate dehydrogenase
MAHLEEFEEIIRREEPLAPYTYLRLGGPAEMLVQPRSIEELSRVVRHCSQRKVPFRILGSGCNLLIRDEGVRGAVLRLSAPAFTSIHVEPGRVKASTGASVSALISAAARHGLSGLEALVGIPGTVGGALRTNSGDRAGDISQLVRRVEVMDSAGDIHVRDRDELTFRSHGSSLDEPVLLTAEFALDPDSAEAIVKRMRKAWILRKSSQPAAFQAAGRVFRNPRGLNATALLEQAGMKGARVGGAEVSDRDPNCIQVHAGATSRDVLRLIEMMKAKVAEKFSVTLEQELNVW